MHTQRKLAAVGAATALALAGCGSSSHTSNGSGGSGGSKTISVGLLYDGTGPAASGNKTVPFGVQAGIKRAKSLGFNVKLFEADTQTSPSAALAGAQKLVEQDHVGVVLSQSSLAFSAAPWLQSHKIPVIGVAEDATEWTTDKNMFSVYGPTNPSVVTTWDGQFFKMMGATNLGVIGYSISPSSAESAEGAAKSAVHAGLKAGYLDAAFPFGSTNVAPEAIAMKNAHIDSFTSSTDPNTSFAFVQALRNLGVNLKAVALPDGYGGDLTSAGGASEQIAKGVSFTVAFEPVEMHTAATNQLESDLKSAGTSPEPTYGEYGGYADMAMVVQALQADGGKGDAASMLKALSGIHSFDAWGLLGSHPIDINNRSKQDLCEYAATWNGSAFTLVKGAEPLCGAPIPGETVKPPS